MTNSMVSKLLEVMDRTLIGPPISRKEWEYKLVPRTTMRVLKDHGLERTFDPNNPINTDLSLADEFWEAGFSLAVELGMFCPETERIVKFTEEEIEEALKNAVSEVSLGKGKDRITIKARVPEDQSPPIAAMSALGLSVSEELYVPICQSIAQYRVVDMLLGACLDRLHGREVRSRTPYETLAGFYEAKLVKEALHRAGRPRMPVFGVEGAPTEYGFFGGFLPGGFEPECTLAICLIPEPIALPHRILHRVAVALITGTSIEAGHMTTIGGYFGPPEGAALGAIAAHILQAASMQPTVIESTILDGRYFGNCGREALWATSVANQAKSRNSRSMVLGITSQVAGPGTDMILYETACISLAEAVSGAAIVIGTRPAACKYPNYCSGLENKFCAEILKASAGMKLSDANYVVKELLPKYERRLRDPPKGRSFKELTNLVTLKPVPDWLAIYERVWKELEELGVSKP